jgi:hypothetical protein
MTRVDYGQYLIDFHLLGKLNHEAAEITIEAEISDIGSSATGQTRNLSQLQALTAALGHLMGVDLLHGKAHLAVLYQAQCTDDLTTQFRDKNIGRPLQLITSHAHATGMNLA